ncbi:hypothetical protein HYDPIDRAFT_25932 [Hydnomerulius pinastri MD-312]|nr:hypothetical protein HYDPIDRAFT_25932 [Hydnomerulius pinastri MD-312]
MSPRNIVIAGETGVGKSSLINLVVGEDAADTSNDAVGVTTEAKYHSWMVGDQEFRLWDTPGLGEGSHGNEVRRPSPDPLHAGNIKGHEGHEADVRHHHKDS